MDLSKSPMGAKQMDQNKGRKVLIIEDDPHTQLLLTKNLELSGYEVSSASDGEEGVRVALKWAPDLILLDLLRKPGSSSRDIPIMIVSIVGKDNMRPAQTMGAISFFNKPFQVHALLNEVQRILHWP